MKFVIQHQFVNTRETKMLKGQKIKLGRSLCLCSDSDMVSSQYEMSSGDKSCIMYVTHQTQINNEPFL